MRKLGIILAVMIAATLGYSGTASAQEQVDDTAKATLCPVNNGVAEGGAPNFADNYEAGICEGYEVPSQDPSGLNQYLCGIADGMDKDATELDPLPAQENAEPVSGALRSIGNGVSGEECPASGGGGCTENCGNGSGDDDDDDTQVEAAQRSNATADGGLPRTGGELFAGAGLGLMSLGALVRRFLP